jgi:hypothetical protein
VRDALQIYKLSGSVDFPPLSSLRLLSSRPESREI